MKSFLQLLFFLPLIYSCGDKPNSQGQFELSDETKEIIAINDSSTHGTFSFDTDFNKISVSDVFMGIENFSFVSGSSMVKNDTVYSNLLSVRHSENVLEIESGGYYYRAFFTTTANPFDLTNEASLSSGRWVGLGINSNGELCPDSARLLLGIPVGSDSTFSIQVLYILNENDSSEVTLTIRPSAAGCCNCAEGIVRT